MGAKRFTVLATLACACATLVGCGERTASAPGATSMGAAATDANRSEAATPGQGSVPSTVAKQTEEKPAMPTAEKKTEFALFGAGCFWGVEAKFRKIAGVVDTAVGYSGGSVVHPTYKQVCTDQTGHAEVVRVEFDPSKVTYDKLLDVFWASHDPTQVNRQGPDFGKQYRTVVFYFSEAQRATAEASRKRLQDSGRLKRPIATSIEPAGEFWRAEEYHQRYLEKQGLEECHLPPAD